MGSGRGSRVARCADRRAHPRDRPLAGTARGCASPRTPGRSSPPGRWRSATNAFPSLLRRTSLHTVPVYDYVLMTEPLSRSPARLDRLAQPGQGIGDCANQFHYYRLTADNRILWGGYDAVYHYGRHVRTAYDQRPATFERLAAHFFATFPQLEGLRFTHRWGGAIDTCTRFCAFFGTALRRPGRLRRSATPASASAPRGSAPTSCSTCSTAGRRSAPSWRWCATRPLPFPPEPFAYAGIQLTRWSLARADERQGRAQPLAARARPARSGLRLVVSLRRAGPGRARPGAARQARPGRTPRRGTSRRGSARGPPRG